MAEDMAPGTGPRARTLALGRESLVFLCLSFLIWEDFYEIKISFHLGVKQSRAQPSGFTDGMPGQHSNRDH